MDEAGAGRRRQNEVYRAGVYGHVPRVPVAVRALELAAGAGTCTLLNPAPATALAVVSIALLLVPLAGIAVLLWRLTVSLTGLVRRRLASRVRTWEDAVEHRSTDPS